MSINEKIATLTAEVVVRDEDLHKALNRLDQRFGSLTHTLGTLTANAAGFVTGRFMQQGLSASAGAAIELESRLANLRKTTGLQGVELQNLGKTLAGLSTTMAGAKLDDLFDIASMGGRLGIAGDKIGRFVRDIGMVKIALDDIPAEQAATDITRILNVFGKGPEEAIRFASALNKLDDTTTATGKDILDIAQRLSGPAATLGLSPQKVLALSAALKDAGVANEVAGTAIGQVFAKMATHTQQFAQVAGVSTQQFARALRADPLVALQLLERGLKRFDEVTRFKALEALDLDGARVATTLLQLGSVMGRVPGYVRTANDEWKTMASIVKENNAQGETTQSTLEQMQNAITLLTARIGSAALPVIKALAESVVTLTKDFTGFLDSNQSLLSGITAKFRDAASYIGVFVREFKTIGQLGGLIATEKFEQLVEILSRLGGQIAANLRVGFDAAVAIAKNAFHGLGTYLAELFDAIGVNMGISLAKGLTQLMGPTLKNVMKRFGIGGVADEIQQVAKVAPRAIPKAADFLGRDKLLQGVALPGGLDFRAMVGLGPGAIPLPNRNQQTAPLFARIGEAKREVARERAAAKIENRPDVQAAAEGIQEAVKQKSALRRLNEENAKRKMPIFRGTERQAKRILEYRERRSAQQAQRDAQKAPKGGGIIGAAIGAATGILRGGVIGAAVGALEGHTGKKPTAGSRHPRRVRAAIRNVGPLDPKVQESNRIQNDRDAERAKRADEIIARAKAKPRPVGIDPRVREGVKQHDARNAALRKAATQPVGRKKLIEVLKKPGEGLDGGDNQAATKLDTANKIGEKQLAILERIERSLGGGAIFA